MNILFLTLVKIRSLKDRSLYHDMVRDLCHRGHNVYVVSPVERFEKGKTTVFKEENATFLNVRTFNLQKTNVVEKGIGTLLIESQYKNAIRRYLSDIKFDLILYSTPPITFSKIIQYIKKRDKAVSYLLLKDIFPQNAIDLRMIKKGGLLHKYFLKKEKKLYDLSDFIGCMSPANQQYLLEHNLYIDPKKVEVNPNSIEPLKQSELHQADLSVIRGKYNIPINSIVIVYGGNLGRPQGIDFLLKIIKAESGNKELYFLIVGSGTEFNRINKWFEQYKPQNASLLPGLPKKEYDELLRVCNFGLILLHPDFTIPNFPSRLLSYLEFELPVIAATDVNTDIGKIIIEAGCGYWMKSGDIAEAKAIFKTIRSVSAEKYLSMKTNAYKLLLDKYLVKYTTEKILEKVK